MSGSPQTSIQINTSLPAEPFVDEYEPIYELPEEDKPMPVPIQSTQTSNTPFEGKQTRWKTKLYDKSARTRQKYKPHITRFIDRLGQHEYFT